MKKWMSAVLATAIMVSMCACGGATNAASISAPQDALSADIEARFEQSTPSLESESVAPEEASTVETPENTVIDMTTEDGNGHIVYSGWEYMPDGTMNGESYADSKIFVLMLDYSNQLDDTPKMAQDDFRFSAFQNGVELNSFFGAFDSDYTVTHNYFTSVMGGATITVGPYFLLEDDSPVTIIVKEKNGENKQSMVIDLSEGPDNATSDAAEPAAAESFTSTDYMTIDGIYVDESYVDNASESLRLVYLFYTLTTPDENLKVDSKSAELTFDGINTYASEHYNGICKYMPSYYYSDYLINVYVGDTVKVVETFKIPIGDLEAGKTLSISKSQVPDTNKISLKTDEIQFCENPETIAQLVDPDGYELETYNRTPADATTAANVQAALNGYYWSVFVNSTSYELEFYEPDSFEMRVKELGVTNSGTYEVLNGYVVCTYADTGLVLEIPYTWGTNDIDLDITTALDVKVN